MRNTILMITTTIVEKSLFLKKNIFGNITYSVIHKVDSGKNEVLYAKFILIYRIEKLFSIDSQFENK